MRVTASNHPLGGPAESQSAGAPAPLDPVAAPAGAGAAAAALVSDLIQPAQQALAELPEIDQAKVAALREALARGEISFDAGRLAALIQRYHGGRG